MKIPFHKRLLSFLYPICIERRSSPLHPVLDLYLHRNQWQLATEDAWYSNGRRYRPLLTAFKQIKEELAMVDHVLVLGTGLASAVQILENMGFHPAYTLVDIDKNVLDLAIELLPEHNLSRIEAVCMDAELFMQENKKQYPLIVCDVFMGRNVPDFVSSATFLEQCKSGLQSGGRFVLNYLEKSKSLDQEICSLMDRVFPGYRRIEFGINKIFVASPH
ncbi:MAG: methyltransferase domain-containing protein [Chitinophagaceae bacterium]